jgi:NurA-like 5'-3' nuclease
MMAGIAESVIAELISKGVEKIANRKKLTSEDLTVLLLHEQSRSIARLEHGVGRLEHGIESIAEELKEFRKEMLPLLTQSKDIADIRAQLSELRARVR